MRSIHKRGATLGLLASVVLTASATSVMTSTEDVTGPRRGCFALQERETAVTMRMNPCTIVAATRRPLAA
jgi:hypothetical protein